MPSSVAPLLGLQLLRRVKAQTPKIGLQIVEAPSGQLLAMMKRGELDAAVLYGPTPAGSNAARLLDDELVLVGPIGLPPMNEISFRRLADFALVLPSESQGLRVAVDGIAAKTRTKLHIELQIDSLQLIKSKVTTGNFFSILPFSCVGTEIEAGILRATAIRNPTPARQLFLTMQSEAESPRAILQVEQFAREEAAALVRSGAWARANILRVGDS
jgi:DNA-binding transcriptional LysR family regulator